jgi:hypothetical protein
LSDSSLRKMLARVFKTLPLNCFDTCLRSETLTNESDEAKKTSPDNDSPPHPNGSQLMISDLINQVLDDEDRILNTEMRTETVHHAAMNRALQIYFSHSQAADSSDDLPDGQATATPEEKTSSQLECQFLEDIGSLRDFSLPTVFRIHRELCGKRIITKRVASGKKKVRFV